MASADVRTGVWIDWTQGNAVKGATITLSSQGGGFLLAFIVLFVGFVGRQVWFIVRLLIHKSFSADEPRGALHFQQQAVYRNSSSAWDSFLSFYRLRKTWKSENKLRITEPVVLAAICSFSFVILALFSSAVAGWGSEYRLLSPKHCGYYAPANEQVGLERDARENLAAFSYARECYGQGGQQLSSPTCNSFANPHLKWTASTAPCPFKEEVCQPGVQGIRLSTDGSLDSNLDLGINESPSNRITYARELSCHLLKTSDGFSARDNDLMHYNYGSSRPGSPSGHPTYTHNLTAASQIKTYFTTKLFHSSRSSPDSFQPIPQLQLNQSRDFGPDTLLLFISQNGIQHQYENEDPVFRAKTRIVQKATYAADQPVVPIACVEQQQLCYDKGKSCTPWVGFGSYELTRALYGGSQAGGWNEPSMEKVQQVTATRISYAVEKSSMLELLPANKLSTGSWLKLNDLLMPPSNNQAYNMYGYDNNTTTWQIEKVPSNRQWEAEIRGVFLAGLAKFQRAVMQPVTGLDGRSEEDWRLMVWDTNGKETCNSQRVRGVGVGTMNFSLLGLVLNFGIGGVLVLVRICVERGMEKKKRDEWERDGVLELQRGLFEARGEGKWEGEVGRPKEVGETKLRYSMLSKGAES
ncbi:hypothetical protein QBC38DRAFT_545874 [Podospora fimiseda]|uniref:Uncharacterized protein n=1 Tax=Podospora fimiseda TaxID=252190 RepID=A0AAN7GXT7_9PEZI|nr:hypothetical protein QBC38DRAFT_545874 [Podospora fimiseda]